MIWQVQSVQHLATTLQVLLDQPYPGIAFQLVLSVSSRQLDTACGIVDATSMDDGGMHAASYQLSHILRM